MSSEKAPPPPLQYYKVLVDGTVPATLEYKILASSPQDALDKTKTAAPVSFTPKRSSFRKSESAVYAPYSQMIVLTKRG